MGLQPLLQTIDPSASVNKKVKISKTVLLVIAVLAALVAQQNPADILFLVAAAFSFAASDSYCLFLEYFGNGLPTGVIRNAFRNICILLLHGS